MSISSEIRRAGPYAGNGVTVNFPFAFKVFSTAEVVVTRTVSGVETVLTLTADYTVTLNANQDATPGGTVTLLTAPATGQSLTLTSGVGNLQPTSLANLGGFYPDVINDSLDRATIQIQQLDERLDRALTLPVSSSGIDTELPLPASGHLIGWDSAATGLQNYANVISGSLVTNAAVDTNAVTQALSAWTDFNDTTTVVGAGGLATFYYPDYYGNPATGRVYRFNRVFIGAATASSSDRVANNSNGHDGPTVEDWIGADLSIGTRFAQLSVGSGVGGLAVVGFSRTSDYRAVLGTASPGSQGINGYAVNDDTIGNPIACGVFGVAVQKATVGGAAEHQLEIWSEATPVTVTPNTPLATGAGSGATIGLNLTAGYTDYTENISCYLHTATRITAKAMIGWVSKAGSLVTSMGNGGAGIAAGWAKQQSLAWYDASDNIVGEIWGDDDGVHVNQDVFVKGKAVWRTIASSAVAVVRNSANAAGDATETAQVTIAIPAGAIGPNGHVRLTWLGSHTNSANVKTWRVRFGASGAGTGGSIYYNVAATSSASLSNQIIISNRNSASSQVSATSGSSTSFNQTTGNVSTSSINTANASEIVISNLWAGATASESMTVERYLVEVMYGA